MWPERGGRAPHKETSVTEAAQPAIRRPASAEQRRTLELHPSQAEEACQVWWLGGQLDPERLERAVAATVAAHDMLRARLMARADHGVEQAIFADFDGLARWHVAGDRRRLHEMVENLRAEPLASRGRWFQAVLLDFSGGGYALFMRMHHALVDGYSVLLVEREIWQRYTEDAESLMAGPAQYADAPVHRADEAELRRLEQWWARHLAGARPTTVLPDYAVIRAAARSNRATELPVGLTAEQVAELRTVAQASRTTVQCVLLTAHMMTLATFTQDTDVVTATPYLNRDDPATQLVVGPLATLLPVRARLTSGKLADNVSLVSLALREAVMHAGLPYDRIVAVSPWANDGFGMGRSAFSLAQAVDDAPGTGLQIENVPVPVGDVRWDLVLSLTDRPDGLSGALVYRADRYSAEIANAFRDHFLALVSSSARLTCQPVVLIPRAGAAEAATLDELPRLRRLLTLADFEPTARVTLDQHGSTNRTGFEARVAGYVEAIRRAGDRPRVALSLGSGSEQAAALLAVWRSGGCAVLLDSRHPEHRQAEVLADADPDLVLSDVGTVPDAESGAGFWQAPAPDADAYVVYTSGTSGRPKGVQITYRNIEHLLGILSALGSPLPGFNLLGPAFDGWIWGTLLPWVSGQPVAFPARGIVDVTAHINGLECSVTLTPTMLSQLDPSSSPATIVSAGEPLGTALAERFTAAHRLINAYGPSEATVCASWSDTSAGEDPTTIGRPAPGVVIRLLDADLRPVPLGALGEICLGGAGLARGYLGQAALTASRFVTDPWGAKGERLYRTGDLGVVGADGLLRFVTRRDGQAKVSGVRIELDEVANLLQGCPGVQEAAAVVVTAGRPVVWAAIVPASVGPPDVAQLRQVCAERLLAEARPTQIVLVPALPRTASGKLDRPLLVQALRGKRLRQARASTEIPPA
jgi:amino acid adenylation domain-containing protein